MEILHRLPELLTNLATNMGIATPEERLLALLVVACLLLSLVILWSGTRTRGLIRRQELEQFSHARRMKESRDRTQKQFRELTFAMKRLNRLLDSQHEQNRELVGNLARLANLPGQSDLKSLPTTEPNQGITENEFAASPQMSSSQSTVISQASDKTNSVNMLEVPAIQPEVKSRSKSRTKLQGKPKARTDKKRRGERSAVSNEGVNKRIHQHRRSAGINNSSNDWDDLAWGSDSGVDDRKTANRF